MASKVCRTAPKAPRPTKVTGDKLDQFFLSHPFGAMKSVWTAPRV